MEVFIGRELFLEDSMHLFNWLGDRDFYCINCREIIVFIDFRLQRKDTEPQ